MAMTYKNYNGEKSVAMLKAAGWTEAEIATLATAPRSKEAEYDAECTYFRWPSINGKSTVGFFTALNRAEKDAYNKYHKQHQTGEGRSSGPKVSEETLAKVAKIREQLLKLKVDDATMALFEEVVPKPAAPKGIVVAAGDVLTDLLEKNAAVKDVYAKIMKSAETAGLVLVNGKFVDKAKAVVNKK